MKPSSLERAKPAALERAKPADLERAKPAGEPAGSGLDYITALIPWTTSISFDTLEYYSLGQGALDFDGSTPFSVAMWIKVTSNSSNKYAVSHRADSSGTGWSIHFLTSTNNSRLQFNLVGDTFEERITVSTDEGGFAGAWRLVVVVYDGSGTAAGVTFYKATPGAAPAVAAAGGFAFVDAFAGSAAGPDIYGFIGATGGSDPTPATSTVVLSPMKVLAVWNDYALAADDVAVLVGEDPAVLNVDWREMANPPDHYWWFGDGDNDTHQFLEDFGVTGGLDATSTLVDANDLELDVPAAA